MRTRANLPRLVSSWLPHLVYIILKGITQFSYYSEGELLKKNITVAHHGENVTLTLNSIKIKNQDQWSHFSKNSEVN